MSLLLTGGFSGSRQPNVRTLAALRSVDLLVRRRDSVALFSVSDPAIGDTHRRVGARGSSERVDQ